MTHPGEEEGHVSPEDRDEAGRIGGQEESGPSKTGISKRPPATPASRRGKKGAGEACHVAQPAHWRRRPSGTRKSRMRWRQGLLKPEEANGAWNQGVGGRAQEVPGRAEPGFHRKDPFTCR